jgi:hypothetical protein
MTIAPVQKYLHTLCQCVKDASVSGGFLLSTGEVSNYWVAINKLRTPQVTDAIIGVLRACLPNFQREANVKNVFVPQLTTTSEDIFPWDFVFSQLRSHRTTTKQALNFCSLNFDRHHEVVEIPEGAPLGAWLGIFAISVHVDMLVSVVEGLQRRKLVIDHILVLLEREHVTRQSLLQRGVHLVPLVVCDLLTGEPKSILDMEQPPYTDYRKYFASGESV